MMPPTMRVFKEIQNGAQNKFAELKSSQQGLSSPAKSRALVAHIEFLQQYHNVHGPHMKNLYDALDPKFKPEDLSLTLERTTTESKKYKPVRFFALNCLLRRVLAALELDKLIIKQAWIDLRKHAEEQRGLFDDKDEEAVVVGVKRERSPPSQ